eukprot:538867_1
MAVLYRNTLIFVAYLLISHFQCAQITVKNVTLHPNMNSTNGATVTLMKDTITNNDKWNLNPTDNLGWHIKITLDSSWGFHSTKDSRITLIINSDSSTSPPLLLAFITNDEFFTLRMFMDNSVNDQISPDCTGSNVWPHVTTNIENIITDNSVTRASQVLMNDYSNFLPTNLGNVVWEYPMQFLLQNSPTFDNINFTSHASHDMNEPFKHNCVFNTAFAFNIGLQIYISGDIGQSYSFKSFTLIYEYNMTPFPTNNPSINPTDNPTASPTICFLGIGQLLNTSSLIGWNKIMTPEIPKNNTFEIKNGTDTCYAISPCILIRGKGNSVFSDVYIEKILNVSIYSDIIINTEIATLLFNHILEFGFIETICDANTPQRIEFNHGPLQSKHYSGCLHLLIHECNLLTVRFGGQLNGEWDFIFITKIEIQFITAS